MKTIRLLYPDHLGGGLHTYYFGANLMAHILPQNPNQPLIKVDIAEPSDKQHEVSDGILAKNEVFAGIQSATQILVREQPEKVITIGGNCLVSQASFDYLHGKYQNVGVIWIDAHPDVSIPKNGYPNAHAMVLGALLGQAENPLAELRQNPPFQADQILYVGLQGLHDYQAQYLDDIGVNYQIQTENFIGNDEIKAFMSRFEHILVHLDIDVLDAKRFHSTYFANPELKGDGSGAGRMTMTELADILRLISEQSDIVGFTVAEYLPFDEYELHNALMGVDIFRLQS